MPIILVFGLVADFYLLWLLVRFAVHALPVYVALSLGLALYAHGSGILGALTLGAMAAVATFAIGRAGFHHARTPVARLMIAAAFVVPAGVAGYQAVYGIGRLALAAGIALNVISLIGAIVIAALTWTQLVSGGAPSQGVADQLQSGNAN